MPIINLKSKLRNKYRAKKVKLDGHTFDSIAESKHYVLLKQRVKAGDITELEIHPRYNLCSYLTTFLGRVEMDFSYRENGLVHVVDIKGMDNALSAWKRKHFQADHPDIIFELIWSGRK